MSQLKNEFSFNFQKKTINVKKIGQHYFALSSKGNKQLQIELTGGVHAGKIMTSEGKFLAWLPKEAIEALTTKSIVDHLRTLTTFKEFLEYVINTEDLSLILSVGNYSWLEYKGEEIEGTAKERFVSNRELSTLAELAGL